jgi:hypothetical protein
VLGGEQAGYGHDRSGLIARQRDERVVGAGERDREVVHLGDLDAAAANGRAAHLHPLGVVAGAAFQLEDGRVRVRVVAEVHLAELPVEPCILRLVVGDAQAQVVGHDANEAADQCAVGAVPLAGGRERAVQRDAGAVGHAAEDGPGHEAEAARACRVG